MDRGGMRDGHGSCLGERMASLPFRALVFCLPSLVACANPSYDPAPPLPPPPSPGILRTAEEEWAPWEVDAGPSEASDGGLSEVTPSQAGTPPWQKQTTGPLPPLPNEVARNPPPPATVWVRPYSEGQWVHTVDYGWIWVPADARASEVDGVPYTYLYTPHFGWTWYISPWGPGVYSYGPWVTRPWRPVGWSTRPWVAHPRVVVRLGGSHRPFPHPPHSYRPSPPHRHR